MIPAANIIEWRKFSPWHSNAQVEQDLILSRVLVDIFNNPLLSENLLFRGGTAINKIFLQRPVRYSEDIDLVQKEPIPIGDAMGALRKTIAPLLGKPKTKQKTNSVVFLYRTVSEIPPITPLRVKIEINTREHFSVYNSVRKAFNVQSQWFSGECKLTTYLFEELLATKLRALYQRSKGRDLFDLWYGIQAGTLDESKLVFAFRKYMAFSNTKISSEIFKKNVEKKLEDPDFRNDIKPILRPDIKYSPIEAYEIVRDQLIEKI